MAVEMYLKLDGVDGAVNSRAHKGWAVILSWSWGLARGRADNASAAVTKGNEIAIVKEVGMESSELMRLCATGAVTERALINIFPSVGKRETQQKYVVIELENVVVKSVSTTGASEENFVREKVTLRFNKIGFEYFAPIRGDSATTEQAEDGHRFDWNYATQKPA